MSTFSLQLLDFPGNYKKGTLPYGPRAYIALKSCSTIPWQDKTGKKKVDFKVISHQCDSFNELQYEISRLIKELKTIEGQAKRFFQKESEKQKKAVS